MSVQDLIKHLGKLSLDGIFKAAVSLAVCLVISRVILKLVGKLLGRSRLEHRLQRYVLIAIKAILYLVVLIIVIGNLGVDMTSLVALLSVASLGITLAAEDVLGNIAGGLVILSSHPFAIGDYIESSDIAGTVEEVTLNHTRLITPDGLTVMLPNKTLAESRVTNYSALGRRRVTQVVTASYDSPTESVMAACRLALERTPNLLEDPAPVIWVSGYGESSIEYTVYCWCASSNFLATKYALSEQIRPAFQELGVEMTYNHLNVHVVEK